MKSLKHIYIQIKFIKNELISKFNLSQIKSFGDILRAMNSEINGWHKCGQFDFRDEFVIRKRK